MEKDHYKDNYPLIIKEAYQVFECTWVDSLDGAENDKVLDEYFEPFHSFNGITSKNVNHNGNKEKLYKRTVSELNNGNVVVVMVGCGYKNIAQGGFNATSNQHFIVLADYNYNSKKIYVWNPNQNNQGWKSKSQLKKFVFNNQCLRLYEVMKTKN